MPRIFSNGPDGDFFVKPFGDYFKKSSRIYLAAPYFTKSDYIRQDINDGKVVNLLIGLNSVTRIDSIENIYELHNVNIRYLTSRFHAKIYLFDDVAMIGSSNLTDGGFHSNRECMIVLNQEEDEDAIKEVHALFLELWNSGSVLTREIINDFKNARYELRDKLYDLDSMIEDAVGKIQPPLPVRNAPPAPPRPSPKRGRSPSGGEGRGGG